MRKEFKVFRGNRCVVTEKVQGIPVVMRITKDSTEFTVDIEAGNHQVFGYISKQGREMFDDMTEMLGLEHEACDKLEAKGEPCNRPDIASVDSLEISGVLIGGRYGHPDVDKIIGLPNLSGDFSYCQDVQFLAEGMKINDVVADYYAAMSMCVSVRIPPVPSLFFGSPKECDKYVNLHQKTSPSRIYSLFPQLTCEGQVALDERGLWQSLPSVGDTVYGLSVSTVYPSKGQLVKVDFLNA